MTMPMPMPINMTSRLTNLTLVISLILLLIPSALSQPTPITRPTGAQIRIANRLVTIRTDTLTSADCGSIISYSNALSIAVTLPIATSLLPGCFFQIQNTGVGTVTITPTTSTIDGGASVTLTTNQGIFIADATAQYLTQRGSASGSAGPAGAGNNTYCPDATGSTTTYTCPSPSPTITSLTGLIVIFVPQTTNTGTSTLNIATLGAKTLKASDGTTNISSGQLIGGTAYSFAYDGTNLRQVSSSGGAGGGTGNAAELVTTTCVGCSSATFTCGSATAATVTSFKLSAALSATIASSSLSTCKPGQTLNFVFQQASSGGPYAVIMPSPSFDQACNVSPVASALTKMSFFWDGTTAQLISCSVDSGPTVLSEGAMPAGAPVTGSGYLNPDSTSHLLRYKAPTGTIYQMVNELTTGSIRASGGVNGPDTIATVAQIAAPFACANGQALGTSGTPCVNAGGGGSSSLYYFNDHSNPNITAGACAAGSDCIIAVTPASGTGSLPALAVGACFGYEGEFMTNQNQTGTAKVWIGSGMTYLTTFSGASSTGMATPPLANPSSIKLSGVVCNKQGVQNAQWSTLNFSFGIYGSGATSPTTGFAGATGGSVYAPAQNMSVGGVQIGMSYNANSAPEAVTILAFRVWLIQ